MEWPGCRRRRAASCGGVQTGYVRNYALGIGIGAVVILAYVAIRVGAEP